MSGYDAAMLRRMSLTDLFLMAALVVAAGAFLYLGSGGAPLVLWDESRTVANALEMHARGIGLVTTYAGAADLWNTKPPLAIWLMTGSVAAFGASEAALRAPTMIASLGTVALVAWFTLAVTRSRGSAALAAVLLVLSPGFFGEHAARTADYDTLLTFFTTGFAMLGFIGVHRARPGALMLGGIAAMAAAALLTKGVAGIVPGVGLVAYVLVVGRWQRLLAWRWLAAGSLALGPVALFVVLREAAGAGYAAAAWHNDVAGRVSSSLIGARQPAGFYLSQLAAGYFVATPLLLAVPVAAWLARGRERIALIFAGVMTAVMLAVVSIAASKLSHYLLPALPFMAVAVAIAARVLITRASATRRPVIAAAGIGIVAIALLPGVANAVRTRTIAAGPRSGVGENASAYGPLLARLAPGARRITVVDPGFALDGRPGYAPVLLAYRLMWRERGVAIGHIATPDMLPDGIVLTCDPATAVRLTQRGQDIAATPGCAAIRR